MKTALCVSGHLRNCEHTVKSFDVFKKNLKEFSEVDVFVATWNVRNTTNSWSAYFNMCDHSKKDDEITFEYIEKIYDAKKSCIFDDAFYASDYSPLKYTDLTDKKYNWDGKGIGNDVVHTSRAYFLLYEANKLKKLSEYESKTKYDLVIRIRPDMEFAENINYDQFKNIEKDTLYIPKCIPRLRMNDRFAYGDSDIMNKYCSSFFHFSSVFNDNIFGDGEEVMWQTHEKFFTLKREYIEAINCLSRDNGKDKFVEW